MKRKSDSYTLLTLDARSVAKMDSISLQGEIDKRVRRVFKLMESDSETVRAAANEAILQYAETQKELFRSKRLDPGRAMKEAIVAAEQDGKTIYRIVPRGVPLEETVDDIKGNSVSVVAARAYSDRCGLARDQRRGKYNDAGLLIDQAAASVDASEVACFVRM